MSIVRAPIQNFGRFIYCSVFSLQIYLCGGFHSKEKNISYLFYWILVLRASVIVFG